MADDDPSPFREYGSDLVVIREIFDGAHELFENELERALEIGCETIIIEPCRLGEETARWILFGNCLQKTSIVTGLGSLLAGTFLPERAITAQYSLMAMSLFTGGLHSLSWQQDSCYAYRVERNPDKLSTLISNKFPDDNLSLLTSTELYYGGGGGLNSAGLGTSGNDDADVDANNQANNRKIPQPVILCRRSTTDIRRSNLLKAAVSLLALAFSVLRIFKTTLKFTLL